MSDKEKETERKRENYNCEAKQGVQGLDVVTPSATYSNFFLLTTNVRQSLPNAFLLSLTPAYIHLSFLFWLGLCLFCFDFRGFLHVFPSNLLSPIVKVMPLFNAFLLCLFYALLTTREFSFRVYIFFYHFYHRLRI